MVQNHHMHCWSHAYLPFQQYNSLGWTLSNKNENIYIPNIGRPKGPSNSWNCEF